MNVARAVAAMNWLPLWKRTVKVWGVRVTPCTGDRLLNLYLHRWGLMGAQEKMLFERQIRPGMTVVDIGANQGLYTLLFSTLVGPQGRVWAFEPDPELFACLKQNCLQNRIENVNPYNLAVGAEASQTVLFRSYVNSGDNRLAASKHGDWFKQVPVKTATLDSVLDENKIDFIKIDVQGWEHHVFRGMRNVLRNNPAVQVYFEVWPFGLKSCGCEPVQILEYFTSYSYSLYKTHRGDLEPLTDFEGFCRQIKEYGSGNLLALPSSVAPR